MSWMKGGWRSSNHDSRAELASFATVMISSSAVNGKRTPGGSWRHFPNGLGNRGWPSIRRKPGWCRSKRPGQGPHGVNTMTPLGFTHYWGKSRRGYWVVKRRTMRKRLRRAMKMSADWCRWNRHRPLKEQYEVLCQKLRGYYHYYGLRGNYRPMELLYEHTLRVWHKWVAAVANHISRGRSLRSFLRDSHYQPQDYSYCLSRTCRTANRRGIQWTVLRNRMSQSLTSCSVGGRSGNHRLYPELERR
jgi:hypothetical protein